MTFRNIYGHNVSENGWLMCNRDECVVGGPTIGLPYTDTAPIRRGDASTILVAWLAWYHRNVEPLSSPVWGWSATNDVANSNHLSGTAVDINAPKYPWGARVMPADRIIRVRKGLRLFEGTIYWGADWSRADEMHYQLGYHENHPAVAAFAAKLNAGHLGVYGDPKPAPTEGDSVDQATADTLVRLGVALLDQLGGKGVGQAVADGKPWPNPAGWPQGGNRSLYDLAAATAARSGVPDTQDVAE